MPGSKGMVINPHKENNPCDLKKCTIFSAQSGESASSEDRSAVGCSGGESRLSEWPHRLAAEYLALKCLGNQGNPHACRECPQPSELGCVNQGTATPRKQRGKKPAREHPEKFKKNRVFSGKFVTNRALPWEPVRSVRGY